MFTAVELGIFDGKRPADCKELPRLLEACVALGLLEKRGAEYVNTPEADKYLRSGSPDTMTGYIRYSNRVLYPMWGNLEDAVREGSTPLEADVRSRWSAFLALLPDRREHARVSAGDARFRTALLAERGGGIRSEPVSPPGRSGRRKRPSGCGGRTTLPALGDDGVRSARGGADLSERDARRFLRRSAPGG